MSEHEWVRGNLDAYVAGALPAEELGRVARHVADCADCKQALTQAQKLESSLAEWFADARPDAKLEERMIRGLRKVPPPRRFPAWMRFAIGAAAAVLLGIVGVIVQAVAGGGGLGGLRMASPMADRADVTRLAKTHYSRSNPSNFPNTNAPPPNRKMAGMDDDDPIAAEFESAVQQMKERIDEGGAPSSKFAAVFDASSSMSAGEKKPGRLLRDVAKITSSGNGRVQDETPPVSVNSIVVDGDKSAAPEKAARLETRKKKFELDMYFKANTPSLTESYFKPSDTPAMTTPSVGAGPPPDPNNNEEPREVKARTEREKLSGAPPESLPAITQPKAEPQPADAGLKIIRTGDIEFEVDSFDNAVKTIMALLKPLQAKGAFKLKEDSSKQANGKVRGHVVVRMPPQFLDDFVLDLRRDLAKVGELKLQQIGSQDVTKVYTDTESELKAARAVEKRLLAIIENGKGDVKDLVAAEKELGLWRMKIEKMEGEIRYFANQVALSTLTITLVEKEIQNAAALVVSGTVKMRIEVDNVSKARESAEKAVEEFKGRIVKSDEKQYPAGQVEAIVHAEIPPQHKDAFRRLLEKLGLVSAHEDTQSQTTEGGSFPVITPRRKINDVLFQVTLNNIVNIKPKQSVKLDIVTADVRTNFEKLKDEIIRVFKGQIRDAKLDENQDKQKAIATIDFSVPIDEKAAMDKLLAGIGPTLDRVNTQAAITEIATEQKFGYQLTLYSIATVEPREKVRLHVEVKNVESQSAEIAELVKEAKGQMTRPKSGLNRAGQTEALLIISVPLVQSDRLVRDIKDKGKLIDWAQAPNTSVPDNELATAQIAVLLTGPNPIIPSDEGLSAYASKSLYVSFTVLAYSVLFILSGIFFLLPWVVAIWIVVWLVRWMWRKPAAARTTVATPEPPKSANA